MADEEKKDAQDPKDAEESKDQEAPVEEPKTEEKPAAPPADDEAGSRQNDSAGGKEVKEETKDETPAEEVKEEAPSPISTEMQDTTGHAGKVIGAEEIKPGMTVRIHERILDISPKGEERERTQVFEGIILGIRGAGNKKTVTVRKISHGVGVEKVFPLASPNVTKIEVVKIAQVRRAKLTYLKNLKKRFKKKLKETWVK